MGVGDGACHRSDLDAWRRGLVVAKFVRQVGRGVLEGLWVAGEEGFGGALHLGPGDDATGVGGGAAHDRHQGGIGAERPSAAKGRRESPQAKTSTPPVRASAHLRPARPRPCLPGPRNEQAQSVRSRISGQAAMGSRRSRRFYARLCTNALVGWKDQSRAVAQSARG